MKIFDMLHVCASENAVYFMKSLNPHNIVETFSCNSGNDDCINSKCNVCETPEEIAEVLSSGGFKAGNIIFNEWAKVDGKVQKLSTSIDVEEISSRLNAYVKTLKRHIHVKRIQNHSFNNLKSNLKPNKDILIQVNNSENYVNKSQGHIQNAYFGQRSFSVFTACCYVNIDGSIINENFTVTSEANDHSRSATMSCWMRVLS